MALIKWSPLDLMEETESMWPEWWPTALGRLTTPAVDLYEEKDRIIAETPIVGVDPDKVNVEVEQNMLKLSGTSERRTQVEDKDYYRKEVRYGSFYRAVQLPKAVDATGAEATYRNGILRISLPMAEGAKPKKIPIAVK